VGCLKAEWKIGLPQADVRTDAGQDRPGRSTAELRSGLGGSGLVRRSAAPRKECRMADPAKFGHDRIGHLLEDQLLTVPEFQRAYAWDSTNVAQYLDDLAKARESEREYFMGTVVLAESSDSAQRKIIVDGQQRLATTAVLLIAIRDRLAELGKTDDADAVTSRFLRRYEISQKEEVTRLVLSPDDLPDYDALVDGPVDDLSDSLLADAYRHCKGYIDELALDGSRVALLDEMIDQLSTSVQILTAVASGIPEAYVIFETLNDRGADLTTADLLKNFLFSQSGTESIAYVQTVWIRISSAFDKPADLVKFIRHDYSSRYGKVTNRQLYRALQDGIGSGSHNTKRYVQGLEEALSVFVALKDPDHARWASLSFDVRDSLLAYRRFGFESSMPLLLAAFREWGDKKAGRLVNRVAGWSTRAMVSGRLGGGSAEEAFCDAACAVADGSATNQTELRKLMVSFVPTDSEFRQAFRAFGPVSTSKAKYLLGMIEREKYAGRSQGIIPYDWSSKGVTIEHIIPSSSNEGAFESANEFERFEVVRDQLWNYALLERGLNKKAGRLPFADKRHLYLESGFPMTRAIGERSKFDVEDAETRAVDLATLAVQAWKR